MKKSFASIFFICAFCAAAFAQKIMVNVAGYGEEKNTLVPIALEWNDAWFEPFDEPTYNHQLARAAGVLSCIAYDARKKEPGNAFAQVYAKFGVAYESIEWHYDINYSDSEYGINQAAYSLARKKLPNGRDLVFAVIRGTPGNEEEWLSNINVWNSFIRNPFATQKKYHEGFLKAVEKIQKSLVEYADKNGVDLKKASMLITGHSRGAASANLLSALLADQEIVSTDRVFTYTFAAPNVTTRQDAHDPKYNFIFNIINGEDIVPTVPPCEKKWRFTKFGVMRVLVNSWNCDDLKVYQNEYIPKMNSLYTKLLGREYHPFNTGTFIPTKIGDSMAVINPTPRHFYKSWFPLHKRLAKTIIAEFPSTLERELADKTGEEPNDESVSALRLLFNSIKRKADTKSQVLIEYSLNAFIDMHAMQSYLSWLLALDEQDLFSERQSSIVRIKGIFNGAVVDNKGNIYAQIYDGVLNIRQTKAPLAAWQIPIANLGPISLGFPNSENFSLLIYKNSLLPTPVKIEIERYAPDGTFLGVISKKTAAAHIGRVYSFDVGKEAVSKPNGSPATYKKLKGLEAHIAQKDGKLINTNVSHMSFGTHIDTEGYWEFGMTSGLQKIYLSALVGLNTKNINTDQSFSLGIGTQHCFWGPIMLNAEVHTRFVRYTGYSYVDNYVFTDKWLFAMVPSTRFMFSVKPAKRLQLFTSLELSYHISGLNSDLFDSGYKAGGMRPWYITNELSISPSIQFGVKL